MRRIVHLLLMSVLFVVMRPALAQDLDATYEWEDEGITVDYPEDWDSIVDENDIVHLTSDETDVFFIFDDYNEDEDIEEYVADAVDRFSFDNVRFDEDDVLIGDLDDFDLSASYFYTDELDNEEFERAVVAIPLDDEIIAIAMIVPTRNDEIDEIDTVFDILATLTVIGASDSGDGNIYEFDDYNYEITLEDGWSQDDEVFSNGDVDIIFEFFEVEDERFDTRAGVMRDIYADFSDITYDEDFVYFMNLDNDDNAIGYYYEDGYFSLVIAFSPDDDVLVVAVVTPSDEDDTEAVFDDEDAIYDFLGTLE